MSQFLLYYQRPEPETWVYLSSFLTIGLYFAFHRFWSVRNLDILLLILLAPGILMVHEGRKRQMQASRLETTNAPLAADNEGIEASLAPRDDATRFVTFQDNPATIPSLTSPAPDELPAQDSGDTAPQTAEELRASANIKAGARIELRGFSWLLLIEFFILVRLLIDPLMVRRPLLDPNLTTGGLVFIGVSMLIFLMANVINSTPELQREQGPQLGPGYPVLSMLPAIPTIPEDGADNNGRPQTGLESDAGPNDVRYTALARTLAILAHLAVVVGITLVGHMHFGNFKAGAGCATLYLMLPYTAQMTGRVDHVLPAALLVWAILMYRKPLVSGICLGLAAGLVYYPAFLLPLWLGFYRQRGIGKFAIGVASTLGVLTVLLSLGGSEEFFERLVQMYGLWFPLRENLEGVWGLGWAPIWRLPILVAFALISALYLVWPRQKNLGTLMGCSAALMVAAQFWHGFGGGLFIGWFLSLFLLTIFRPNLEDRVAVKVIGGTTPKIAADRVDVEAA